MATVENLPSPKTERPIGFVGVRQPGSSASTSIIVRIVAIGFSNGSRLPSSCSMK